MVSDLVLFQVATFSALIGMTLGWRGVMTRYSGFYDLPTAWSQVFWGIIVGMFYATSCDSSLFIPYLEFVNEGNGAQIPHPMTLILLTLFVSIAVHLLLRRDRVRKGGSHPTSGWALGLAIGGMTAMVLIYRYIFIVDGTLSATTILTVAALAILTPRCEAMITCHQGYLMLNGKRWGAVFRSAAWRIALLSTLYYSVFDPFGWIFIASMMMIVDPKIEDWIWSSIPKPARRRLRRIWAANEREKRSKQSLGEEE